MSHNLPLRVLVKGASTVNWTSWMGGPRTDFTFPRVIEEQLLAAGQSCEVRTITMTSERASTVLGTWQREILGYSPDVIVLVYGHYESIHLFLPHWLERHANSLKARPRWWSELYRRRVLRPIWMVLAHLQALLDKTISPTFRHRERQVSADLERYIGHVQKVGSPLVLCFELLPPAKRYHDWFPGMTERIGVMNRALQELVRRLGLPQVRYFRVRHLAEQLSPGAPEEATQDGFHYTPELHRVIGEAVADEIAEWARAEPHLGGVPAKP